MTVRRVRRRLVTRLTGPAVTILQHPSRSRAAVRVARRILREASPVLEQIPDDDLVLLAAAGEAGRLVLGDVRQRGVPGRTILGLADRPSRVGAVALALGRAGGQPGELSAALYESIVLQQAGQTERTQAALIAVRRHPELLALPHALGIAARALSLASQPLDPYDPHPLRVTAAATAAAVVAAREELDPQLLRTLAQPELRFVSAAAVQGRLGEPERLLGGILNHLSPTEPQAQRFARSCDRNFSTVDDVGTESPVPDWLRRVRAQSRRVTDRALWLARPSAVLVACAAAAGAGLTFDAAVLDLPEQLRVTGGVALGALAVLVAVHVVSAELAADRLAGPIARATSVPLPLATCYVISGVALVLGQLSRNALDPATLSAISYGLATGFAVSVGIALMQLLARTDSTAAAVAFERRRRARFRAGGRDLGRLHAGAIAARETIGLMPWVKIALSPPLTERRIRLTARRDGWLWLSHRGFLKLAEDDWWKRSAGRLWLAAPAGTHVDRGQEVAALTGGDNSGVPTKRVRQVRRLLSERSAKGAEQAAEAVGVLVDLMARQGASGNEAGGFRVADATVALIEAHLDGLIAGRGESVPGESGGPVPALRTAAVGVAQALARADHPGERDVLQRFVRRMLPLSGPDDPFCAMLLTELDRIAVSQPASANTVLWDVGVRVAECQSSVLAVSWTRAFDMLVERSGEPARVIEVAGRVVSLACYVDVPTAHRLYRALDRHADLSRPEDVLVVLRIGAAAVRAGALSVAMEAALQCRAVSLGAWDLWAADHDQMTIEAMRNEFYGLTLGPDPQRVLQRFLTFAGQVKAAV